MLVIVEYVYDGCVCYDNDDYNNTDIMILITDNDNGFNNDNSQYKYYNCKGW